MSWHEQMVNQDRIFLKWMFLGGFVLLIVLAVAASYLPRGRSGSWWEWWSEQLATATEHWFFGLILALVAYAIAQLFGWFS